MVCEFRYIIKTNILIGQEDSLLEHTHMFNTNRFGQWGASGGSAYVAGGAETGTTTKPSRRYNANENRVVNFTYILWKRIS